MNDINLDYNQLGHTTNTVAHVTVTKDGKTARAWLGLKVNNRDQIVVTLTTQTTNGETVKRATAPWQS